MIHPNKWLVWLKYIMYYITASIKVEQVDMNPLGVNVALPLDEWTSHVHFHKISCFLPNQFKMRLNSFCPNVTIFANHYRFSCVFIVVIWTVNWPISKTLHAIGKGMQMVQPPNYIWCGWWWVVVNLFLVVVLILLNTYLLLASKGTQLRLRIQ